MNLSGGGGVGVRSVQTQQKLTGFPCCTFTRTKTLLGGSDPRVLGWRGAEIHADVKEGGALFTIHPFLVALNNHTDKKRRVFAGRRGHREHT